MTIEEAKEYFAKDRFATEVAGINIDEVAENYSKVSMKITDGHRAAHGGVMGGAIYTIADFAFAVASNTPEKLTVTTTSTINYLGQAKDDILIAECSCIKEGRRSCVYKTEVKDGQGTLVAYATSSGMHMN